MTKNIILVRSRWHDTAERQNPQRVAPVWAHLTIMARPPSVFNQYRYLWEEQLPVGGSVGGVCVVRTQVGHSGREAAWQFPADIFPLCADALAWRLRSAAAQAGALRSESETRPPTTSKTTLPPSAEQRGMRILISALQSSFF